MKYRNLNSNYYFNSNLLTCLNLPIQKYSLKYILNKVIYYNDNSFVLENGNFLKSLINQSMTDEKIDYYILKFNIKNLITNNLHEKVPNYLDLGFPIKSIVI
jgi:hypothetical protein